MIDYVHMEMCISNLYFHKNAYCKAESHYKQHDQIKLYAEIEEKKVLKDLKIFFILFSSAK